MKQLERRWRPVETRPDEGWHVLPPLGWVLAGAAAAAVLLVLTVVAAVCDH